jgi:hypothetical protein
MTEEDDDSLFAPKNANRVAFALELLIGINVIAIELAILVYLITVVDPSKSLGALAAAIQRTGADANIFTRIFMLSGFFFFSLFYALWVWLYRGLHRVQWLAGGLGYLISTASMIAFKFRAKEEWIEDKHFYPWLVFGSLSLLAAGLVLYAIISITMHRTWVIIFLGLGSLLLLLAMPVTYISDSSGVVPVLVQLLGMLFFIVPYIWHRRTSPPSEPSSGSETERTDEHPLLGRQETGSEKNSI